MNRGPVFPAREVNFNPTNDVNLASYFPIAGPFAATGGRAFNDPMARGGWSSLPGWTFPSPSTGDFTANTGEVAVTALSLGSKQWMELALGVRKVAGTDANSRCIFHVIPAVKYA